jgi:response regulator RpfG family c-di-GMP phosphodiesterase
MKKIILILGIVYCDVSYSNNYLLVTSYCKQGAERNSGYALYIDNYLFDGVEKRNMTAKQITDFKKHVLKEHEKYIEKESDTLYKNAQKFITENNRNPIDMDTWRNIMEITAKLAFINAMENFNQGNEGKSKEYYERKIYDGCTAKFNN